MKPTVFNYQEYERVVEENKKLKDEVADLDILYLVHLSHLLKKCLSALPSAEVVLQTPQTYGKSINPNTEIVSDLISRADAIDTVEELNRKVNDGRENDTICTSDVLRRINALPSADAVEVVQCKDCKWYPDGQEVCQYFWDNDFCSYGERKEP